jgi:hypothetical protein
MTEREMPLEAKMEAVKQELIQTLGDMLHDEWREPRKQDDGTFDPRDKSTDYHVWTGDEPKDFKIDIANLEYKKLPPDWKGENKISAEVAVTALYEAVKAKRELDEAFVEAASTAIHDAWRERNGSWAPPEQMVDFDELSEEEKEKDRVIARAAVEKFNELMG